MIQQIKKFATVLNHFFLADGAKAPTTNSAISQANAADVTIHAYFGTSGSKHRDNIATEYARVAIASK